MRSIRSGFGLRVDRGPMLSAARLALLGPSRGGLAFADRWRSAPRRSGRVLCSGVLADQWPTGRGLGLPWGAPMRIGSLTVASGPAGSSPEAAVLRVQLGDRLLICALAARGAALPGCQAADVDGADILLLDGVGLCGPASSDTDALTALTALGSGGGVVLVDDGRLATAVAAALPPGLRLYTTAALGHRIERLIGRPTRRVGKRLAAGAVLLWPGDRALPASVAGAGRTRLHFVDPACRAPVAALSDADAWLRVPWSTRADEPSLRALITQSGATDVVVWHDRADDVCRLEGCADRLWHLAPDAQLPLV